MFIRLNDIKQKGRRKVLDRIVHLTSYGSNKPVPDWLWGIYDRFGLFNDGTNPNTSNARACEFYDNEENFAKLKSALKETKCNIKTVALYNFPREIRGEFDSMLLSNIYDYCPPSVFLTKAKSLIDNNLKKGGTMQMHYVFNGPTALRENIDALYPELQEGLRFYSVRNLDTMDGISDTAIYPIARNQTYIESEDKEEEMVCIYTKD